MKPKTFPEEYDIDCTTKVDIEAAMQAEKALLKRMNPSFDEDGNYRSPRNFHAMIVKTDETGNEIFMWEIGQNMAHQSKEELIRLSNIRITAELSSTVKTWYHEKTAKADEYSDYGFLETFGFIRVYVNCEDPPAQDYCRDIAETIGAAYIRYLQELPDRTFKVDRNRFHYVRPH